MTQYPYLVVIGCTAYDDSRYQLQCGYMTQDQARQAFVDAMVKQHNGEVGEVYVDYILVSESLITVIEDNV